MNEQPVSVPVRAIRLRDRLCPVLTAIMAGAYYASAQWAADEHVLRMNSCRILGALMAGSAVQSQPEIEPPTQFTTRLFPGPGTAPTRRADTAQAQQREYLKQLKMQVGTVEVVVHVWRRAMWGLAAGLALCAVLAVLSGWIRFFHILAAALILLSTVATMVGMWFLVRPDWGGMPPLPAVSHVLTALVQSAYAWVLLILFARRGDPQSSGAVGP